MFRPLSRGDATSGTASRTNSLVPFTERPYLGFSFTGHVACLARSRIPSPMSKISIRFFDDREVHAVWDEEQAKWWFTVLDMVAVLTDRNDYGKTRNYWTYPKGKLKRKEVKRIVSLPSWTARADSLQ
jgi:hypothetical protein